MIVLLISTIVNSLVSSAACVLVLKLSSCNLVHVFSTKPSFSAIILLSFLEAAGLVERRVCKEQTEMVKPLIFGVKLNCTERAMKELVQDLNLEGLNHISNSAIIVVTRHLTFMILYLMHLISQL
jgi:hypothetical protein